MSRPAGLLAHKLSPTRTTHRTRLIISGLQLDQNRFRADSMDNRSRTVSSTSRISYAAIRRAQALKEYKGGYDIRDVKDAFGRSLDYTVTDTNMRIDLPAPLEPGKSFCLFDEFCVQYV